MSASFSFALRINGPIPSSEISNKLNLDPTETHKKGKENIWLFSDTHYKNQPHDAQLDYILRKIEDRNLEFIELSNNGCTIQIICFFCSDNGQGSIILNKEFLRRLASLPISDVKYEDY